jgi:hypothetical protein
MYCVDPAVGDQGPAEEIRDEFLKEMENYYTNHRGKGLPPSFPATRTGKQPAHRSDRTDKPKAVTKILILDLRFPGW